MNELKQAERQAIEKQAKCYAEIRSSSEVFQQQHIKDFIAGAEFLAQIRKEETPSKDLVKEIVDIMEGYETRLMSEQGTFFAILRESILPISEEIAKLKTPDVKGELFEFAEWCSRNGWKLMNGESMFVPFGCWYDYEAWQDGEGVEQWYTTDELYEYFKNAQSK